MERFLGFPIDASAHGHALDDLIVIVHWLMLVLFVGWGAYFLYVLWRFRAKRNPQASYQGAKGKLSTWSEIGVAVVEAALLIGFGVPVWAAWVSPPPPEEDPLVVRVVSEQFAWNIHYPGPDGVFGTVAPELMSSANPLGLDENDPMGKDDVVAVNQLRLPVDRPVTVRLSSKDVIHSFALPYLRVKQDAVPGMEIPVHFKPVMTTPTEQLFPKCAADKSCWEIACAQLCGLGHFRMRGYVNILSEDEFNNWMAAEVAKRMPAPQPALEPEAELEAEAAPDATG